MRIRHKHKKNTHVKATVANRALPFLGGFTLVEIIVSVAIFTIVVLIAVSALLSIVDINRKTQATKAVMDNMSFALESMTREIKVGTNYQVSGVNTFSYLNSAGDTVEYRLNGEGQIERLINGVAPITITSPEVTIKNAEKGVPVFTLFGELPTDKIQPFLLIRILGSANLGSTAKTQSDFNLQTSVSQRVLDVNP